MLSVEEVAGAAAGCVRCSIRKNTPEVVFGKGSPDARIMVVLEAPDADAAKEGKPISGEAGELLYNIFAASHIKGGDVYVTNLVKCNPPEERTPTEEEIGSCKTWLDLEIAAVQPDYLILMGVAPLRAFFGEDAAIQEFRGKWRSFGEIKVLCTYQPKTLLKKPEYKRMVWEDFKMLMRDLGILKP